MHPANWALHPEHRRNLEIVLNILVARTFDLPPDFFAELQRDCQHESNALTGSQLRNHLPRRGYWRIDADRPPAQRLPNQLYEARHRSDDELLQGVRIPPINTSDFYALDTWWKLHQERLGRIAVQVAKLQQVASRHSTAPR